MRSTLFALLAAAAVVAALPQDRRPPVPVCTSALTACLQVPSRLVYLPILLLLSTSFAEP